MKLNKERRIGRVLFIVEGSSTEFTILRRIFCNVLGYSYLEKRRNRPEYFKKINDKFSQVAVINTQESNIRDISFNDDYLDAVFDTLRETYKFPVEQSAVYYLFDRDPKSNTDTSLIERYIDSLSDPYDNENDFKPGQLLLSYPSIESFTISNFMEHSAELRFELGADTKKFIGQHTEIQMNKISAETLLRAADEFLEYLMREQLELDIDRFSETSHTIFSRQEKEYLEGRGFRLFSMLTLAFLQLGILEL